MYMPNFMRRRLLRWAQRYAAARTPDLVINNGYLFRWHWYRNKNVANVYIHMIAGNDDDRALHDHPWWNASILLSGSYYEHLPGGYAIKREPGSVVCRRPKSMHRLELADPRTEVWSLFVTGPKVQTWGFQTDDGWVPWYEFLNMDPEEDRD